MDNEGQDVWEAYVWLYIGLIGFGFGSFVGIIPALLGFLPWIVIGLYKLIKAFIKYQWPNRYEYIDFWRSQWVR